MTNEKPNDIAAIFEYQPQLREKMVVDLVNGLQVVEDHLRCSAFDRPLVAEWWQLVTGHQARQQYEINRNLATGLEDATSWLQDLQAFQVQSDLAIAAVARKLAETRAEVRAEASSMKETLEEIIESANHQFDQLTQRVAIVEAGQRAQTELALAIQRANGRRVSSVPLLVAIYLVVDRLWWGRYGTYCRMLSDVGEVRDEIQIAGVDIGTRIGRAYGVTAYELLPMETELNSISGIDDTEKKILAYTPQVQPNCRVPMLNAIREVAESGSLGATGREWLPTVASPVGMCLRLFHESRRLSGCLL